MYILLPYCHGNSVKNTIRGRHLGMQEASRGDVITRRHFSRTHVCFTTGRQFCYAPVCATQCLHEFPHPGFYNHMIWHTSCKQFEPFAEYKAGATAVQACTFHHGCKRLDATEFVINAGVSQLRRGSGPCSTGGYSGSRRCSCFLPSLPT